MDEFWAKIDKWIKDNGWNSTPPPNISQPPNCPPVNSVVFKDLSHIQRIAHKNLNPQCENHAKFILAPNGFDENSFTAKNCQYIGELYKKASLLVHPDKNPTQTDLAKAAFIVLQKATETLCPKA